MARGSKIFRPADVPESNASSYPEPFREGQRKRYNRRLGDHAGLKNYGVNLIRVLPGGQSSARHAHSMQDEFVYVIEGELILQEDDGETVLKPGDAAAFKAGSGIAHCLINRTERDAVYLEVGTRAVSERVHYPDVDFLMERDTTGRRYFRKSGEPIEG